MDEKSNEILKKIEDWALLVRRYMKHDIECAIWSDANVRVCDCGLDAAIARLPKHVKHA